MRGGRSLKGRGGLILIKRGAGGGKGGDGAGLYVRGNYKYFLWGRGRNVAYILKKEASTEGSTASNTTTRTVLGAKLVPSTVHTGM